MNSLVSSPSGLIARLRNHSLGLSAVVLIAGAFGCGSGDSEGSGNGGPPGRGGRPGGGMPGFGGPPAEATAIPVRTRLVETRRISDFLQTTGALEAENEVDIVSRIAGPIVELRTEEGRSVQSGQLLAKIDDREVRADLELARVSVAETKAAYERARRSFEEEIISAEAFDSAKARYETAEAQVVSREIQLSYTEIRAPFGGRIIERAIKLGEFVSNGSRLFRVSDFDPLLCPVQIPEKDLGRVSVGQRAQVRVEAFAEESFNARVLRVNPVIDSTNGTVEVTLEVAGRGRLRPGMFATVFLEVDAHENALVVPKRSLVLEGVGDTVYVVAGDVAERREVTLGFEEADSVEITGGLETGDEVIVLGQDSLTDGTAVYVLERETATGSIERQAAPEAAAPGGGRRPDAGPGAPGATASEQAAPAAGPPGGPPGGGRGAGGGRGGFPQIDWDDPEQVERVKSRMREFGLSDEQIEQRLERMKQGGAPGPGGERGGRRGRPPGGPASAGSAGDDGVQRR